MVVVVFSVRRPPVLVLRRRGLAWLRYPTSRRSPPLLVAYFLALSLERGLSAPAPPWPRPPSKARPSGPPSPSSWPLARGLPRPHFGGPRMERGLQIGCGGLLLRCKRAPRLWLRAAYPLIHRRSLRSSEGWAVPRPRPHSAGRWCFSIRTPPLTPRIALWSSRRAPSRAQVASGAAALRRAR